MTQVEGVVEPGRPLRRPAESSAGTSGIGTSSARHNAHGWGHGGRPLEGSTGASVGDSSRGGRDRTWIDRATMAARVG